jgi:hypothetical protein
MKGIIINIFEEFICNSFGEDAWDRVLHESKAETDVFVGPKTYSDEKFMQLLMTSVSLFRLPWDVAVRSYGKFIFPHLIKLAPYLVEKYQTPEEVLLNLDGIIHAEVKKFLSEAQPPKFIVKNLDGDRLSVEYISERNLCLLVEGLLEGLAEHYGSGVDYTHSTCVNKGDESCIFEVKFSPRAQVAV